MYIKIPIEIKQYYKKKVQRFDYKLNQALHYWKVRCKERESFAKPNKKFMVKMTQLVNRLESLEYAHNKLLGRQKRYFIISRRKARVHPLFVTDNEYRRIMLYFSQGRLASRLKSPKGKMRVYLTQWQIQKLEKMLAVRVNAKRRVK